MKKPRFAAKAAFCVAGGISSLLLCGSLSQLWAQPQAQTTAPAPIAPPPVVVPVAAVMPARADVLSIMRRAADYQLDVQSRTKHTNNWIRAAFYTGVLGTYRATGDTKYREAAVNWGEASKWIPPTPKPRFADNQACIQVYAELYELDKNPAYIARAQAIYDAQLAAPIPGRLEWWWCDALYMAPPSLARMAKVTGDKRYAAFLHNEYWDSKEFLYDKDEHLFFRDKSFFNKKTANGKKVFWGRGNGWVIGGLARTIEYLSASDPNRADYVRLFREMATRLAGLQQADGLWRSSLLDADQFPLPETSGSAFFTYALAWGVNSGVLDKATFLPVVQKGWAGLTHCVNQEGRLGYVQRVAGAPGLVRPEDTQEYAVGAFLLAGEQMAKMAGKTRGAQAGVTVAPIAQVAPKASTASVASSDVDTKNSLRFNFGMASSGAMGTGWAAVGPETTYQAALGFGWVEGKGALTARDRGAGTDAVRRDFIVGTEPRTFRVNGLKSGRYLVTVVSGDTDFGNHETQVSVQNQILPVLRPARAEFATLKATVDVAGDTLFVTFGTPADAARGGNWVVNALTVAPSPAVVAPVVSMASVDLPKAVSTWPDVAKWPDPTAELLSRFRQTVQNAPNNPGSPAFSPTGLTRADYLKIIAGEVDFWKTHQNADGAIIDPYRKVEFQYSTPAFAHAASALVVYAGRKDLLEPAAKALDWSARTLSQRKAATGHEDFFAPMIAHAIPLLKPLVPIERSARWEADIRAFDPFKTYRSPPGSNNWNVVAASGEARFQQLGLRPKTSAFVENSFAGQGHTFGTPYGLYLEGPMPYDHFPRLWAADMLAGNAYDGAYKTPLSEVLRRAAITSLFMQSPWGELPAGGRSAQHQWNEAEQCVTYEIYANDALKNNDADLAAVFKRAAHLSLGSMRRWVRPSGEMQIVKNWVDPAQGFAFEGYSAHSQYNLLPMAMLAIAYEHAQATEAIAEKPAPADQGGYVLSIEPLHKVFANVGGTYIEIDTKGDHHYDATGLIRVQYKGVFPQVSTSDSILAHPSYRVPAGTTALRTTGIGVSWQDTSGAWRFLGELDAKTLTRVTVGDVSASSKGARFTVRYEGDFGGPTAIIEEYLLVPGAATLTTHMESYDGPLRYVWPVFAGDGKNKADINIDPLFNTVTVSIDGGKTSQTWTPVGSSGVEVEAQWYPNHNGWARFAAADYPAGTKEIKLGMRAQ